MGRSEEASGEVDTPPGDFEQAHAVDEHIEISEVAKAAEIYARAARALLV